MRLYHPLKKYTAEHAKGYKNIPVPVREMFNGLIDHLIERDIQKAERRVR